MSCRRLYADRVTEIDALHPGAIMRRPRETRFPTGSVGADREQKKGAPAGITTKTERKESLEIDINRPITKEELIRCLSPVVFIKSLTKDKK